VKRVLQSLHAIEQRPVIHEGFQLLPPVRKRDYQLVPVAIRLPPDLEMQSGMLALEEPKHATDISALGDPGLVSRLRKNSVGRTFRCAFAMAPLTMLTLVAGSEDPAYTGLGRRD